MRRSRRSKNPQPLPEPPGRAFGQAQNGLRTRRWNARNQTANADLAQAFDRLVSRSQDNRDSLPFSDRAIEVLVGEKIGRGFSPRCVGRVSRAFKDRLNQWCESKQSDFYGHDTFYGLQYLMGVALETRGSFIIRRRIAPENLNRGLNPLQIQVLEDKDLDTSKDNGTDILGGKRYDSEGREVSCFIYKPDPLGGVNRLPMDSVEVFKGDYFHVYRKERPTQYTGIPAGKTTAVAAKDLNDGSMAELLKMKMASALVMAITTGAGVPGSIPSGSLDDQIYDIVERLQPGATYYLRPGENATFNNPPTSPDFMNFFKPKALEIAAGYGLPYEFITGDLTNASYTALRMARMLMQRTVVGPDQQHVIIGQALSSVADWYLQAENMMAALTRQRLPQRIEWIPDPQEMLDPKSEIPATVEAIKAGLNTLEQEQIARRQDPETVAETASRSLQRNQSQNPAIGFTSDATPWLEETRPPGRPPGPQLPSG